MTEGFTLDVSDNTLRHLLVEAVRDCDVDYYWILVKQGANPLQRWPLPEVDADDHYPDIDDDWFDYDRGYRQATPTEMDTILFHAANSGCAEVVEHILSLGEQVDHIGQSGLTALMQWARGCQSAETHCNWELTGELLLQAGADPNENRGEAWKIAGYNPNGRAKRMLLGWKAQKKRDHLSCMTPTILPETTFLAKRL